MKMIPPLLTENGIPMKKDTYFLVMSIILLLVTIIGFIPSFLLRPYFKETELPVYFVIHGVLLFAWFSAYFHQNYLLARGMVLNHKRNGRYWFILAIFMALANFYILYAVSRETMEGTTTYWEGIRTPKSAGLLVLGTGYLVLTSTALLIIAYLKRNKVQVHKRAVLGASVILLGPAFDRFLRPLSLDEIHPILPFILIDLFPISLIIYDIAKRKSVHWVTVLLALLMFLTLPFVFGLSSAGLGEALVEFLGSL